MVELYNSEESKSEQLCNAKAYLYEILEKANEDGIFTYIYSMTTENIAGYMPMVHNFSKVLCVASSGDHLLNCVACGSNEVTLFDVNPLTYYMTCLKIGALHLKRTAFIQYFTVSESWNTYCHSFMNKETYNEFAQWLPEDVREFWDTFYVELERRNVSAQESMLFRYLRHSQQTIVESNMYLSDNTYEKMLALVDKTKIRYLCANLKEVLTKLNVFDRYNAIMVSNISDYLVGVFGNKENGVNSLLTEYNEFTDKLVTEHLAFGGQLFYAYIYQAATGPRWSVIDNIEVLKDYFKPFVIKVLPAYCRRYEKDNSIVDAVLIKENWFVNGKNVCMNK